MSNEKPTCHILVYGPGYRCYSHHRIFLRSESCPGFGIVMTPEKCAHKTWRDDVGEWVRRCADCGLIRDVTVEEMRGVSTKSEKNTVSDLRDMNNEKPDPPRCAKCNHFVKEASCIVRRCPCDCDWIRLASDPTAELRERIEALRPSKDRFLSAYEEGRRDTIHDVLDILDTSTLVDAVLHIAVTDESVRDAVLIFKKTPYASSILAEDIQAMKAALEAFVAKQTESK